MLTPKPEGLRLGYQLAGIVFAVELIFKLVDVIGVFLADVGDLDCAKLQPQNGGFFFDLLYVGEC